MQKLVSLESSIISNRFNAMKQMHKQIEREREKRNEAYVGRGGADGSRRVRVDD